MGAFRPTVNVDLNVKVRANLDLVLVNPSYVFAAPVLGGQLAVGMMGIVGHNNSSLNGTITGGVGPFSATQPGSFDSSLTGFGDLYPQASLRWNQGVHNFMTYVTGDIPVGAYNSRRLANLSIGHGAIDGGAGYTYFNPQTGHEFSAVGGFTYNFKNTDTQYRNGVDFHLDGHFRSSYQSSCSSVSLATPISKSQRTVAPCRFWSPLSRASPLLARKSDICFQLETCRAI